MIEEAYLRDGFGNVVMKGLTYKFQNPMEEEVELTTWENGTWELTVKDCGCCGFAEVTSGDTLEHFDDFVYMLQYDVRHALEDMRRKL